MGYPQYSTSQAEGKAEESPTATPRQGRPKILTDIEEPATLQERIVEMIRTIYDPEIPVNIYEMGLIYGIEIDEAGRSAHIRMTLTSPACPVAGSLPGEVQTRVQELDELDEVEVELVWDPPWSKEMLSEEALLQLGLM